jgi:hypothetical protein
MQDWREDTRKRLADKLLGKFKFLPAGVPNPDSFQRRVVRQRELFHWLSQKDWEFFVTVQFGVTLVEYQVLAALKRMDLLLDQYWLGREWFRKPSAERTDFVAVPENGPKSGNTHVHLLLNPPLNATRPADWRKEREPETLTTVFTDLGRRKGVCPRGDVRFKRIGRGEHNLLVSASYLAKGFVARDAYLVLAQEFHRRQNPD